MVLFSDYGSEGGAGMSDTGALTPTVGKLEEKTISFMRIKDFRRHGYMLHHMESWTLSFCPYCCWDFTDSNPNELMISQRAIPENVANWKWHLSHSDESEPGWKHIAWSPDYLAHRFTIFLCIWAGKYRWSTQKYKYEWQRSSSWAINYTNPHPAYSIENYLCFSQFSGFHTVPRQGSKIWKN